MNTECKRITRDQELTLIALVIAKRSTCRRRQVGCVLVDKHFNIIGTGHNGNPRGQEHCIDVPCPGVDMPSGTGLHLCKAVHAEINALMQCSDVERIHMAVCTTAPCSICLGALLNTGCQEILFIEEYPHDSSKRDWESSGRIWRPYK